MDSEQRYVVFMLLLALVTLALLTCDAKAEELSLMRLRECDFAAWHIDAKDDPYFDYTATSPGEHWTQGASFTVNFDLIRYGNYRLYWDNRPYMNSTNYQVREAAWQWEAGLGLDRVDLFYAHLSRHALDTVNVIPNHFPLENFVGARIHLYTEQRP